MPTRDEAIEIAVDDRRIAGTLVTPATVLPGVLFVHGWGASQEQYLARAQQIAALGCVCLAFDLRGHARDELEYERVTREDNLRDVVAAYDLLVAQRLVDDTAIAVIGSSYGGYLASILTSLRPVRWLGLRAPALYQDQDWAVPKRRLNREELARYRRRLVRPEENRALRACAAFAGDVLGGRIRARRCRAASRGGQLSWGFCQGTLADAQGNRGCRPRIGRTSAPASLHHAPDQVGDRDGARCPARGKSTCGGAGSPG